MPNIGPVELVIILVIALLIIGPGKLPDVGSALGKSIREFRKAATDVQESVRLDVPAAAAPAAQAEPAAPAPAPPTGPPIAVAAVPIDPVAAFGTPGIAANPSTLGAPPAPDPAATAADAATEARV